MSIGILRFHLSVLLILKAVLNKKNLFNRTRRRAAARSKVAGAMTRPALKEREDGALLYGRRVAGDACLRRRSRDTRLPPGNAVAAGSHVAGPGPVRSGRGGDITNRRFKIRLADGRTAGPGRRGSISGRAAGARRARASERPDQLITDVGPTSDFLPIDHRRESDVERVPGTPVTGHLPHPDGTSAAPETCFHEN